jgi:hypothetical protein
VGHQAAIFINYRRKQTSDAAGRLADALAARFGENEVFIDARSIDAGTRFDERILETIDFARAIVVVIGPGWLETASLENPNDWVRLELEHALKSEPSRIVPVVLEGARMPDAAQLPRAIAALATQQAMPLRYTTWKQDVEELSRRLEARLKSPQSWQERGNELRRNLREPSGRRFYAPGVTEAEIAQILRSYYQTNGMESQVMEIAEGRIVQAKTLKTWKRFAGLATTADVLIRRDGDFLLVEITPGKWGERAAVGAVTLLYLPLAAVPAFGAWQQAKLPERTFDLIRHYVEARDPAASS